MLKNNVVNVQVIEKVAKALEELNDEVIYVGGSVVSYYITDPGAEQARPTKDIDISVQISSYKEMDDLREKLATKGIYPSSSETVMYRYDFEDVRIDFIPYEETPLGPTNSWLKPGFAEAYEVAAGDQTIKILPVNFYLATKWEAHKSRGGEDPRMSHDFEDIIYVLDNNIEVLEHVNSSDRTLLSFLQEMANEILNHPSKLEIIECHMNPFTSQTRVPMVLEKLEKIKGLKIS